MALRRLTKGLNLLRRGVIVACWCVLLCGVRLAIKREEKLHKDIPLCLAYGHACTNLFKNSLPVGIIS